MRALTLRKGTRGFERVFEPRVLLITATAALLVIGLVMVYSASAVTAINNYGDIAFLFTRHLTHVAIGLISLIGVVAIPYRFYNSLVAWGLWGVTVLFLIVVLMFSNGDSPSRWIFLQGISFQPSEFAKITVILLTTHLACKWHEYGISLEWFLQSSLAIAVPSILILLQPDLGTFITLLMAILALAWIGEMPRKSFIIAGCLMLVSLAIFIVTAGYRLDRLSSFFDPWSNATGGGYQIINSYYALGGGDVFGLGLGMSRQKLFYLPEAENDFIFSIIGEEFGFVGATVVVVLFVILVYAAIRIAIDATDLHGRIIAAASAMLISFQAFLNICSVIGLVPITGKPLPFISLGGTSMLTTFVLVGLILSVSYHGNISSRRSKEVLSKSVLHKPRINISTLAYIRKDSRILTVFITTVVIAIFVIIRLFGLQIVEGANLSYMAEEYRTYTSVIPARRGTIYDRNGRVLAVSIDAISIYANTKEIDNPEATAAILAKELGGNPETYYDQLTQDTTFVYIERKADTATAEKLQQLGLQLEAEGSYIGDSLTYSLPRTALYGIHYLDDVRRVYPQGLIGAQIVGMVNVDDEGISGLELVYERELHGVDGITTAEYEKNGMPIIGGSELQKVMPVDGQNIIISIDIDTQQLVEAELLRVGTESGAIDGSVILLDGATGEIVASASLPLYDLNVTQTDVDNGATTLKGITAVYEPGGTMMTAVTAAVLDEGALTLSDEFNVPEKLLFNNYSFRDSVEREDKMMSLSAVLAHSSVVGTILAADTIGYDNLSRYLETYGFGGVIHVDYPGEDYGFVPAPEDCSTLQAVSVSFGQGMLATSLQIVSFYGAIANEGVRVQPHFLLARPQLIERENYGGEQIMKPETAVALTGMLVSAVTDGTGNPAQMDGYQVAGKSGTAEKASITGGYLQGEYIYSFVGYIANSNSKLTCIVSLDIPTDITSVSPAAPLFKSIMDEIESRGSIEPYAAKQAIFVSPSLDEPIPNNRGVRS